MSDTDLMINFQAVPDRILHNMRDDAVRVAQFPKESQLRRRAVRAAPELVREIDRRGFFVPEVLRSLAEERAEIAKLVRA